MINLCWRSAAPQANTADLGPITRPIWKTSCNNTIVLEIRGKRRSYELMQTGEKSEKKRKRKKQSKAAVLEYQNLFSCLIKKWTFSKMFELAWSLYVSFPNKSVSILIWILMLNKSLNRDKWPLNDIQFSKQVLF